jgi:outer membrane protein
VARLTGVVAFVAAALVALAVTAAAAQDDALRLTLDDAIARAAGHSARLAELRAREEGAAAAEEARRVAANPIVTLQGGYTRTNHVDEFTILVPGQTPRALYPDIPDNYRTRFDLQWPLYTGGRTEAMRRAAASERAATASDTAAAREDVKLEVTRAFWMLLSAAENERVVGQAVVNLDAHVRDLRTRLEQGLIPPNEVLTVEAQRSRQQMLAIEARNTRMAIEADLRRLVDAAPTQRIEPLASLTVQSAAVEAVDRLIAAAREGRVERRALQDRIAAARARLAAVSATRRPQAAVQAGYDYARPNPRIFPRVGKWHDSWDVSINASWALWDGGRRKAEEREAEANVRALEARLAELDRQMELDVRQRVLDIESSAAAIAAAADAVAAATEARRVVAERYRAGVATSTDILDAELAVLQADLDRTRALAGAQLARARLARALGQ